LIKQTIIYHFQYIPTLLSLPENLLTTVIFIG